MISIYKILPVGFASNTYLVTENGVDAVAIDPSQLRIETEAKRLGLTIRAVLLTHGHFDHVGACEKLYENGAAIYCGQDEVEVLRNKDLSLHGKFFRPAPLFPVTPLVDGQVIELCGIPFKVIFTPGHTKGSVTYRVGNNLFTGDTLFKYYTGRTDLPTGDEDTILTSVKKLYALPGDYNVYPGHDDDTTLEFERKHNYSVREG